MTHIGNISLLQQQPTGMLASRLIRTGSVIPALDWAIAQANNPQTVIMSGFQSTLEKKILRYLLSGKCGIILVLARSIYKKIPPEYAQPLADGRMLILSLSDAPRTNRNTAHSRNEYIAQKAASLVFISLNPHSTLNTIYQQFQTTKNTIAL